MVKLAVIRRDLQCQKCTNIEEFITIEVKQRSIGTLSTMNMMKLMKE